MHPSPLSGVYAAALTPLKPDQSFDPDGLVALLHFFAARGCHGALLLGTTGEGPSFSPRERGEVLRAGLTVRQTHAGFRLLAGTGTPSLDETIFLTKEAFDLGYDGVVVLPPYYLRKVSDDGLFAWFSEVLRRAVPAGGHFLGYHIPPVSGVPLSLDLLARLKDHFPDKFAGIKDSSAQLDEAQGLGERFGTTLAVFNGTDRLLTQAYAAHAAGSITALANLISPDLRRIWDAHQQQKTDALAQASANTARDVSEKFPPAPAFLKRLLAELHGFPTWAVKPPLMPIPDEVARRALTAWKTRGQMV
ncbi:MAG: dihydrodipicolinate synthase family protein [Anaerolineales bacterium]|nr:dihydrodipicolinate synthase family protein [Anaerolineales bacterium]